MSLLAIDNRVCKDHRCIRHVLPDIFTSFEGNPALLDVLYDSIRTSWIDFFSHKKQNYLIYALLEARADVNVRSRGPSESYYRSDTRVRTTRLQLLLRSMINMLQLAAPLDHDSVHVCCDVLRLQRPARSLAGASPRCT